MFLAGGQRRTVCELCIPRAAADGWLREADSHDSSVRPARGRRTGSLLGRLRQLREPAEGPLRRDGTHPAPGAVAAEDEGSLRDGGLYEFLDGGAIERAEPYERELYIDSVPAEEPVDGVRSAESEGYPDFGTHDLEQTWSAHAAQPSHVAVTSGELKVARALEVFNAGEQPRRVAGVTRSLGVPSITARALDESGSVVAIVVAWELCWYRYEVDLGDEAAGPQLAAQGMELDELPEEDRIGNVAADERGELTPLVQIG